MSGTLDLKEIFVSGIDTDAGKTVVAAILMKAFDADYWKPVQSGAATDSDTQTVRELTGYDISRFHPEAYRLQAPLSPHAAAEREDILIDPAKMVVPETERSLIIEGAGGLMVPLNREELLVDWAAELGLPVVLVSLNRLGSINQTLLSIECLLNRGMEILGVVFNGEPTPETESVILSYSEVPCLGNVSWVEEVDQAFIDREAAKIRSNWSKMKKGSPDGDPFMQLN